METTTRTHARCFYWHLEADKHELLTIATLDPSPMNLLIKHCKWHWKGYGIAMEKAIYDQMVKWTEDEELALYLSFAKRYPSGMKVTKVWRIDRHTPNESKGDTVLLRAKHSVSKTK